MKAYLYYAAALLALGAVACVYIFQKMKSEKPGDATGDFFIIVIVGEFFALAFGYAVMIVWRKFVAHDPDISGYKLYGSILFVVSTLYSALQTGLTWFAQYMKNRK